MSYRVEIKVVIYAETRQVAESFAATVETYIGETFTPETAVYTARIEEPLDADGKSEGAPRGAGSELLLGASTAQCPIEYTGVSGASVQCKLREGHQGYHDFMPQPPPARTFDQRSKGETNG